MTAKQTAWWQRITLRDRTKARLVDERITRAHRRHTLQHWRPLRRPRRRAATLHHHNTRAGNERRRRDEHAELGRIRPNVPAIFFCERHHRRAPGCACFIAIDRFELRHADREHAANGGRHHCPNLRRLLVDIDRRRRRPRELRRQANIGGELLIL
jgi:hypothetical protein